MTEHPKAGKAGMDHETTVEVDGRLVERPATIIEKDAGGVAHDVTDWTSPIAPEPVDDDTAENRADGGSVDHEVHDASGDSERG